MGSAWRSDIHDMAAWSSLQTEEVDLTFKEMFEDDAECLAWEKGSDMDGIEEVVV
jgi:hypothetical protein